MQPNVALASSLMALFFLPFCVHALKCYFSCRYSDFFLEDVVLPQRSQTLMLAGPAELLQSGPLVRANR